MKTNELLDSIVEKAKNSDGGLNNVQVRARSGRADTAEGDNKAKILTNRE